MPFGRSARDTWGRALVTLGGAPSRRARPGAAGHEHKLPSASRMVDGNALDASKFRDNLDGRRRSACAGHESLIPRAARVQVGGRASSTPDPHSWRACHSLHHPGTTRSVQGWVPGSLRFTSAGLIPAMDWIRLGVPAGGLPAVSPAGLATPATAARSKSSEASSPSAKPPWSSRCARRPAD